MYNDPIEEKLFTFFLNFKNDETGLRQISEPVKFDSANFVIEQDSGRYGRDVSYGNEEISLEFYQGYFNGLTHELDNLLYYLKRYGFESEVEFILKKSNIEFIVGVLDFEQAETDGLTYFKTKIIQNTTQAQVKRREDIKVDVFSDKDLDGNDIAPLEKVKVLLKAKPITRVSAWECTKVQAKFSASDQIIFNPDILGDLLKQGKGSVGANNISAVKNFGIEDTLSYIFAQNATFGDPLFTSDKNNFAYLFANERLTDINIKLTDITAFVNQTIVNNGTGVVTNGSGYLELVAFVGYEGLPASTYQKYVIHREDFGFVPSTPTINLPNNYVLDIPSIEKGQKLWIYFSPYAEADITFSPNNLPDLFTGYNVFGELTSGNIEITATSTAFDSIIDGVRHIDYVKQNFKSATGLDVIAPKYDVGGQFYDNFVFNGYMIRQFKDKPFYATIKDNIGQLSELNSDYQVNKDNVYIGQYKDFYPNREIGAFLMRPNSEFKYMFNPVYGINTFEYGYKSYEQDRDEKNTIDAVHTDSQWLLPNKSVEKIKKVEIDFVRDPFEIESNRRQNIQSKETTSLGGDDKVFIMDCVPLPMGTTRTIKLSLNYTVNEAGNLLLLADDTFRWDLLGFQIGDILIVSALETHPYIVVSITGAIVELDAIGYSPGGTSNSVFTITYPITTATYVNRTNEGFTLIDNVLNGDNFGNLLYTPKRNMLYWEPYLATASQFRPEGIIRNTYFKSNGLLTTRFGLGGIIVENEDLNVNELDSKVLTPFMYETELIAEFEQVKDLLDQMQTIYPDGTIGGFIRISDNNERVLKVYNAKLDYEWATKKLSITGEEKFESDFIEIDRIGADLIEINEAGYPSDLVYPINFVAEGNKIQFFDIHSVALTNKVHFDKVQVNGFTYDNITDLCDAIYNI